MPARCEPPLPKCASLIFSLLLCKIIIRAIRRVHTHAHTRVRLNSHCCAAERSRLSIDRDMRFHLAIMMDREPVYAQSFITTSLLFLFFPIVFSLSLSFFLSSFFLLLPFLSFSLSSRYYLPFSSRRPLTSFAKRTARFVLIGPVSSSVTLRINRLSGSRKISSELEFTNISIFIR